MGEEKVLMNLVIVIKWAIKPTHFISQRRTNKKRKRKRKRWKKWSKEDLPHHLKKTSCDALINKHVPLMDVSFSSLKILL